MFLTCTNSNFPRLEATMSAVVPESLSQSLTLQDRLCKKLIIFSCSSFWIKSSKVLKLCIGASSWKKYVVVCRYKQGIGNAFIIYRYVEPASHTDVINSSKFNFLIARREMISIFRENAVINKYSMYAVR